MFIKALEVDPWLLAYVPDNLRTRGMCEKSVNIEPWLSVYIRDNIKTKEMRENAINRKRWLLECIPDNLKTQKICRNAVEEGTSMPKYVPDQYIMQEMCNEAHGCNGLFVIFLIILKHRKCVPAPRGMFMVIRVYSRLVCDRTTNTMIAWWQML